MSLPILPLAVWQSGTNENSIPANDNALRLEALSRDVISKVTTAQPVSPGDGDVYIIPPAATGTQWATFDIDDLTIYRGGTWYAWAPVVGVVVNVSGTLERFAGSAGWTAVSGGGGGMTNPMTTLGDIIIGGASGTPTRLGIGTSGQVLTVVAGSPAWAAATALTNWTEAVNTSAPNATVPAVSLTATNAATNVDAVIAAKGNGATLAQVPDNTTTGGNKRGQFATDHQKSRVAASQVAVGNFSVVGGGQNNAVAAAHGTVCGGLTNNVNDMYGAIGGGQSNTAGARASIGGGASNTAQSAYSAIAGGESNTTDGEHSWIPGGLFAAVRAAMGFGARASGRFAASGDAQSRCCVMRIQTTDATQTTVKTDTNSVSAANQVTLPNNSSFMVKGTVVARQNTTGDAKSWEFDANIKRGANAAATAMVAAATVTSIAADAGAAAWAVAVDADTTNGCLRVRVTGEAAKTIRWVCDVYSCVEVVG